MTDTLTSLLKNAVRTIPDYPYEGIMFRDITTLIGDAEAFRTAVDKLTRPYMDKNIKHVAGIEARGFIFGGAMAHQLSCGFVPIRKPGKLPSEHLSVEYELEYGKDKIEMHKDAVAAGDKVLLVDDLIATGGTAMAALELLEMVKAEVVGTCFVIDLPDLGGAAKIRNAGHSVRTLIEFEGE